MAGFVQYEKRIVTMKDGAIYKTKIVARQWFPIEHQPEPYSIHEEADRKLYQWVPTGQYHFGKAPP